jgi:murein DD-endopeptidase MepM/ murein hydrolase activator NlpD
MSPRHSQRSGRDAATRPTRRQRVRATAAAILLVLLTSMLAATGSPASADDLEDQRQRTAAEVAAVNAALERLTSQLEGTSAELVQTLAEIEGIQVAIGIATEALAVAEAKLAELQREAAIIAERLAAAEALEASITAQIAEDTARANETRVAIGQMARDAYKGDMAASALSAMLDAESTDDFAEQSALAATALRTQTHALRELEQITGVNRNREARLVAVREEIARLKAEADAKVVEADAVRVQAEAHRTELVQLEAEQKAKAAALEAKKAEMLAQEEEYQAQQAALASRLAEIIRQQEAQANGGGTNQSRPLGYPVPPVPYITSNYGWRLHPVLGIYRLHAGTDFRAYCGNPIIAARSGTVQWATYLGGYGNQVMLNHGYNNGKSLMTSYNHLSGFAVSAGQSVSRGQTIGYSGTTGTSTACHLHFEVYVGGVTVNPVDYIG